MHPTKYRYIWQSSFREDFKKWANQKQELPVAAIFVNHFVLIHLQTWLSQSIPVLDWSISKNLI
jgi:hypothetical protein